MKHNLQILVCVLTALSFLACGGDEVTWPEKPADGTPVVIQFVKIAGEGDDMSAKMRVFNFGEQSVTRMQMTLEYLDADGKKLGDFPWSQHAMSGIVDKKAHKVVNMGALIKKGTTKVRAVLSEVEFRGGKTWKKK